tara:strand:- start:1684 stop:1995 length:312 start_codon:yes stop_codon:yes gene_type:complete
MKKIFLFLFFLNISTTVFSDSKMELGLDIYNNKAQCGTCHILNAAISEGEIGPNLDNLMPTLSQVMMAVKNGIGVMPSFDGILTSEEIEAVSYFVSEKAGKNN